jgi:glycine hydroxymethyltransferase
MKHLLKFDPEIYQIIQNELTRQRDGLEMIASENYVSSAVLATMGTVLTNKYAEGYPDKRYYGGNEFIDQAEKLAISRAKEIFHAEHVNVQPHSGSQANAAAYLALLEPGETVLSMSLSEGGHLTHGHKVNFSGKYYKFIHYGVNIKNGLIDFDEIRQLALNHRPKLILAGASAYPRIIDFKYFRDIADEVRSYFMVDMAHIAGLVATGLHPDPVPLADVITATTHKTLRGPRGAIILSKNNNHLEPLAKKNLAQSIDSAVFPGIQGGPLEHIIAAKAVAFKEALLPEFKNYQQQVLTNAQTLAQTLQDNGLELVSGGTDNHLLLIDLTNTGYSGREVENALDEVGIYANKNTIPGEKRKPTDPSGLRLGTPAITTRGLKTAETKLVGELLVEIIKNLGDNNIKIKVKKTVLDLTKKFPLYSELL